MAEKSEPFITVASAQEIGIVQSLWREYWRSLELPCEFQSFGEEIITLPGLYAPPRGRLLIAYFHNDLAGTAALRPIDENSCGSYFGLTSGTERHGTKIKIGIPLFAVK